MTLAEKILALRTEQGLSQGDLAEKLEVSRQSVSKWETGQATPDLDKIIKLADLFGVTVDELIREEKKAECHGSAETGIRGVEFKLSWLGQEEIWKCVAVLLAALGILCLLYSLFAMSVALLLAAGSLFVLPERYWLIGIWLCVSVGLVFDVPNGGWLAVIFLVALCLAVYNERGMK